MIIVRTEALGHCSSVTQMLALHISMCWWIKGLANILYCRVILCPTLPGWTVLKSLKSRKKSFMPTVLWPLLRNDGISGRPVNGRAPRGKKLSMFTSRYLPQSKLLAITHGLKMEDQEGLRTCKAAGLCANKQRLKKLVSSPQRAGDGPHSASIHHVIRHWGQEPAGKRGPSPEWQMHHRAPSAGRQLNWVLLPGEGSLTHSCHFSPQSLKTGNYLFSESSGCR